MERKFYRTKIMVEVLSQDPYDPDTINQIAYDIAEGDCSREWDIEETQELTAKECAEALIAQGSDPEFFGIDEKGRDIHELEESE